MSSGPVGFIGDGYDRQGYIAATEFYPAVSFQYRPATVASLDQVANKSAKLRTMGNLDEASKAFHEWTVSRIVSWDLRDAGNHEVPRTLAGYRGLVPKLEAKIFGIITGAIPSDPIPGNDEEKPASETDEIKN